MIFLAFLVITLFLGLVTSGVFKTRPETIGDVIARKLRDDPYGWRRSCAAWQDTYTHEGCGLTVNWRYSPYAERVSVTGVPLTSGEQRRIKRGLRGIDRIEKDAARADALHKYKANCA